MTRTDPHRSRPHFPGIIPYYKVGLYLCDRKFIHHTIHSELGKGMVNATTKARYLAIADDLVLRGAEGVILGCTEIPLLIRQEDVAVPVFDTTKIHADAAVRFAVTGSTAVI